MEFAQLVRRPVRQRRNDQPTPSWEPAVLCLGPAAGTFGLAFAAGLQGNALAVWPISIALLGVLLTVRRRIEAARLRAAADEWIARGWEGPAARYAWRIEELTSPRERKVLGGSIRSVVRELEARRPAIGSLVNRRALYPHRRLLVALADRLAATGRPVSASGMLAVQRLLTLPDSPLYARPGPDGPARDTGAALGAILDRLEVRH
jgi:hypothetical protein